MKAFTLWVAALVMGAQAWRVERRRQDHVRGILERLEALNADLVVRLTPRPGPDELAAAEVESWNEREAA